MRSSHKYDGPFARDVEGTSRTNFTKEDVDNEFPEKDGSLIAQVRTINFDWSSSSHVHHETSKA